MKNKLVLSCVAAWYFDNITVVKENLDLVVHLACFGTSVTALTIGLQKTLIINMIAHQTKGATLLEWAYKIRREPGLVQILLV
jgi:hypothetical protein